MTIEILTIELQHRENAARHLKGFAASWNQNRIAKLYDLLNALHIARLESA